MKRQGPVAQVRISRATGITARAQAGWIVAIEPWQSLGYRAARLAPWLAGLARARGVFLATVDRRVVGLVAIKPDFLLGDFIALVAVRPEAAGRGVGRALVGHVEAGTFAVRRWLYTSSDATNRAAAAFYRKLGFARVGRLPDLIRKGRVEILWRKGRS